MREDEIKQITYRDASHELADQILPRSIRLEYRKGRMMVDCDEGQPDCTYISSVLRALGYDASRVAFDPSAFAQFS